MQKAKKQKLLFLVAGIACLWIMIGIVDFSRIHSFERPIFWVSPSSQALQDNGSGTYVGFGYSFEVKGNFMPEDELPGVTEYAAKIFSIPIMAGVRD